MLDLLFGGKFAMLKRFQTLENMILEQSNEIATLKMQIASIRGSYAVSTRDNKTAKVEKALKEMVKARIQQQTGRNMEGYDVITVLEPDEATQNGPIQSDRPIDGKGDSDK